MPDGAYEHDVLAWSQRQADLLRRLGRGERINDVDWTNLAEEIESLGLSELHSVESDLNRVIAHLLKLQAWPDSTTSDDWHTEVVILQRNARRRFTPSMRQRIDLDALYADAIKELRAGDRRNTTPRPWPETNKLTLDQLPNGDADDLVRRLSEQDPA